MEKIFAVVKSIILRALAFYVIMWSVVIFFYIIGVAAKLLPSTLGAVHILCQPKMGGYRPPLPPGQPKIRNWLTPPPPLIRKNPNLAITPTCQKSYFVALQ